MGMKALLGSNPPTPTFRGPLFEGEPLKVGHCDGRPSGLTRSGARHHGSIWRPYGDAAVIEHQPARTCGTTTVCLSSWKTGSDKRYRSVDSRGGGDGSTLAMSAILEARKVVRKFRAEPLLGPFSDIATSALNAHVRLFCPAFVHSCRMAKLQLIRQVGQLHKRHPAEDLACSVAALHISSGALVHMLTVPDVHTCTNRFVHLWSRAGLGLCSCAWLQSCHFAIYG